MKADDGPMPVNAEIGLGFVHNGGNLGEQVIKLANGRYRTRSMMPDYNYTIGAGAPGYDGAVVPINLPEGAVRELTLELKKQRSKCVELRNASDRNVS